VTKRDSPAGGTLGHSAGADESRTDSFDGALLLYGVVIGPLAVLLGAAIATLAGASRTLTMIAAVATVVLAGFCADPALRRLKPPNRR
jgi:hypothetical protein